jgi:hypothetical protein
MTTSPTDGPTTRTRSRKAFDVAVAWRIYPGVSKTPLIHADDKLAMVATNVKSFHQSAQGLKVRYYFILDGCPERYVDTIHELLAGETIDIIRTDRIGNQATFLKQIDVLLGQDDAEVVYFAEDDYLYKPAEFVKLHHLITTERDVDFVTCYCHNDIFTHPIHEHSRQVKYASQHLWIGDSSTCLTFMTTRAVLAETAKVFRTYRAGNHDCSMWLTLTRTHLLNARAMWRLREHTECRTILKLAWKHGWRHLLTMRRYSLWAAYPGIGTHLEASFVSPETDWRAVAYAIEQS